MGVNKITKALKLDALKDFSRGTAAVVSGNYEALMPNVGDWYYREGQAGGPEVYIRQSTYMVEKLDPAGSGWVQLDALNFTPATVAVSSPNGGDSNLYAGVSHTITWSVTNLPGNVTIKLHKASSGVYTDIATVASTTDGSATGTGSYPWTIPSGTTPAADYKIYIRDDEGDDGDLDATVEGEYAGDFSNEVFTIIQPLYAVAQPTDPSIIYGAGSTQTAKWTAYGGSGDVKLFLIKAALVTGTTYAAVNSNPDTITDSSNGFITAGFTAGSILTVSGSSEAANNTTHIVDAVAAGTLTLSAASSLTADAAEDTWIIQADRPISSDIETTIDNSENSATWEIPIAQNAASHYKIKVEDSSHSTYNDSSDNAFEITAATIGINQPTESSEWQQGTDMSIAWTSSSYSGAVKIILKQTSQADVVLDASEVDVGQWTWSIGASQAIAANYKIRVEKTADSSVYGESNFFGITQGGTTIDVEEPEEDDNWPLTVGKYIRWEHLGITGCDNVGLELWRGGSKQFNIIDSTANDGLKYWTVGYGYDESPQWQNPTPATNYKIKIVDVDDANTFGYSDEFQISSAPPPTYDPDNTGVWLSTTSGGGSHYTSVIPITQDKALYGRASYDAQVNNGYGSGQPKISFSGDGTTSNNDGNGNSAIFFTTADYTVTDQFNLKSDLVGTKTISWDTNTFKWHETSVDDNGHDCIATFGQYHVWGATRQEDDDCSGACPAGTGLAPDSTDMDTNFGVGRKSLKTTGWTDFGDYKQITTLNNTRVFFAIQSGMGTLTQFQGDTVSDFSNVGETWTNLHSSTVSWANTGTGSGATKDFNVYFTNLIGAGTYYYRVRTT